MSMKERLRKAVMLIAATQDKHIARLPLLERSLVPLLTLASSFYKYGVFIRRLLYQFHILRETRLPVPVVSVGNITWGGTGKTPMVEYLARLFLSTQLCPLILTRGYGGGDEVRLLQKHLEGTAAKLGVGPNRVKLAMSILQHHSKGELQEIGVLILDDGMQHWAMARDVEIVMLNVVALWGNGRMVPRGPLRESLQAFKQAQVVVLHHIDLVPEDRVKSVRGILDKVLRSGSIVIGSCMRPCCFHKVPAMGSLAESDLIVPLEVVQNAVVLCVSGIGCPESLALVLQQAGALHVERLEFGDHHSFDVKDLDKIQSILLQLQLRFREHMVLLVLSEKDYARDPAMIAQLAGAGPLVLHSQLEIVSGYGDEHAFGDLLASVAGHRDCPFPRLGMPKDECSGLKALCC